VTKICDRFGDSEVRAGETRDLRLDVSESYTGDKVSIPFRVVRARQPGPAVFVTAATHGDETNGTGIVHELISGRLPPLVRGTVLLVPVVNVFGFEVQQRYMPDGRDLNRCFPGSRSGSLTRRFAASLFDGVVSRCDYGIDLHTATRQRINYPNIRGDLSNPEVRRIAEAFGCELIVDSTGPEGSLRGEATRAGCPTVLLEAGEAHKIQPGVLEVGVRGVLNVLRYLEMLTGPVETPRRQYRVQRSTWIRAEMGGLLRFHVAPGEAVEAGQPIATNTSVYGTERNVLKAGVGGMVLGMTTLPIVKPGQPVCHLAEIDGSVAEVKASQARQKRNSLERRVREQLASNISVTERVNGSQPS
jgi:predicted deacylase